MLKKDKKNQKELLIEEEFEVIEDLKD